MKNNRLNKRNIIRQVSAFVNDNDYLPEEVIISYGAAIVLHDGCKTTEDIDLWVSRPIWVEEIRKGGFPYSLGNGLWGMSVTDNIDIHIGWDKPNHLRQTEGNCIYVDHRTLLKEHTKLNRDKYRLTNKILGQAVLARDKNGLN